MCAHRNHRTSFKSLNFRKNIFYPSTDLPTYLPTYLSMAVQTFGPWPLFQFLGLYTVGRTPWTGDQPVAGPLPTRTHDTSVRVGEDGHCNRLPNTHCKISVRIADVSEMLAVSFFFIRRRAHARTLPLLTYYKATGRRDPCQSQRETE
jgi:hypothetical protein